MAFQPVNEQERPKPKRVHVVVNPALSRRVPLLAVLNQSFRSAGIQWDISVTHGTGDGTRLARRAIEEGADVVSVYGGDGTVVEVAAGLIGTEVPIHILGGGTGNLVALELRLPTVLERACELVCRERYKTKCIDVGMMGDQPFVLRIGCGIETGVVQEATRDLKDQFGKWAYVFAAIKQLQEVPEARYELVIDGRDTVRATGVSCVVANVGSVGVGRLTLAPSVDPCDGQLDLFLLKKANLEGIIQLASQMMGRDRARRSDDDAADLDASEMVTHWRVREAEIRSEPVMDIQVDGDVLAKTPQRIVARPRALRVVV